MLPKHQPESSVPCKQSNVEDWDQQSPYLPTYSKLVLLRHRNEWTVRGNMHSRTTLNSLRFKYETCTPQTTLNFQIWKTEEAHQIWKYVNQSFIRYRLEKMTTMGPEGRKNRCHFLNLAFGYLAMVTTCRIYSIWHCSQHFTDINSLTTYNSMTPVTFSSL